MLIQLILLGILSFSSCISAVPDMRPCGDWHPYLDEKCIKIFDETHSFDDAVGLCKKNDNSDLISIHSQAEQDFLIKYIFKEKQIVDTVWIGVKQVNESSHKFKWIDGKDLDFSNWASGKPINTSEKACVMMMPDGAEQGKWNDVQCKKKNLVVCQKMQTWSLTKLQQTLLYARKEFQEAIEKLEKDKVPIGFIYIQLPNEKSPDSVWPTYKWTDVSINYAGVFFRVEGGNAGRFGQIQEENAPRTDQFERIYPESSTDCNFKAYSENAEVPVNGWSKMLYTGGYDGHSICTRIHNSGGEVRPKNMAIRIWKRTG